MLQSLRIQIKIAVTFLSFSKVSEGLESCMKTKKRAMGKIARIDNDL